MRGGEKADGHVNKIKLSPVTTRTDLKKRPLPLGKYSVILVKLKQTALNQPFPTELHTRTVRI
jgi:hypothetical protein